MTLPLTEITNEIDLNDPLHLISCVMDERSAVKDSSVVDQNVYITNLCLNLFGNPVHSVTATNVTVISEILNLLSTADAKTIRS